MSNQFWEHEPTGADYEVDRLEGELDDLKKELATLRAQRDDLLAALKLAVAYDDAIIATGDEPLNVANDPTDDLYDEWKEKARKAIQRAEAGDE